MTIREFGQENEETLLFFPGSCEPWQVFRPAAEALAKTFHVFLVTPDGHEPDKPSDFISVEKTVDDTLRWLRARGVNRLDALYGLSFGGGMAVRLLVSGDMPVKSALIDAGTAPYAYPKWVCKLICVRDFLMIKAAVLSLSVMKAAFPPERFAQNPKEWKKEYGELRRFLKTFSSRTIWNIFWSANNYAVPKTAPKMNADLQFWIGADEWGSRFRDLKWYRTYLPQMEIIKIPGMMHGEFVGMHPEAFAEQATAYFHKNK